MIVKKLIKRLSILIIPALLAVCLCACSLVAEVNLTPEQSSQIAEYAAGLLRKYDKNGATLKNLDSSQIWPELEVAPTEAPTEEPTEVPTEEPTPSEPTAVIDGVSSTLEVEDAVVSSRSIADAIGVSDFDIRYASHEICKTYPKQEKNSWLISMSAADGDELLVVHFSISNVGSEDAICDLLSSNKKYRALINGAERINEQVTLVPDSFSQFRETIAVGDSKDAVLIFEISEELASDIHSLQLIVKDDVNSEGIEVF